MPRRNINRKIPEISMYYIYTKQRIKEIKVEVENNYKDIPNSSLLFLTKYSDFEESFFESFGNKLWVSITSELFTSCIINLLLTGKIRAVYFLDRKSVLFNLIKLDSEGFKLNVTENSISDQEDILSNNILLFLSKSCNDPNGNFTSVIKLVIDQYTGTGLTSGPEKKFFYEYFKKYSKKFEWIRLKEERKLLGLILNYKVEIDNPKKNELFESHKRFQSIKFNLRKSNLPFRNFIEYVEQIVRKDFLSRYPGD